MPVGIPSWHLPRFYPSVATTLVVWGYSITSRPNYCSGASSHHLFTSQYYSNLNFSIIWEVILFINFNLTYINVKKLHRYYYCIINLKNSFNSLKISKPSYSIKPIAHQLAVGRFFTFVQLLLQHLPSILWRSCSWCHWYENINIFSVKLFFRELY